MTYNRKKINTKGEKAPSGYHYMTDDSLMSDEEHEKIYGKSFTTTFDCLDCLNVLIDGGDSVIFVNPSLNTSISVTHPLLTPVGGEIAKRGDRFWKKVYLNFPNTPAVYVFREFQIGANCSITHTRDIAFPDHLVGGGGSGMCATVQGGSGSGGPGNSGAGAQVLTIGSVQFPYQWLVSSGHYNQGAGSGYQLAKIGIPSYNNTTAAGGYVAYAVPLYPTSGYVAGDIVYIPSSNTHVTSESVSGVRMAVHYDEGNVAGPAGAVLGMAQIPSSNPFSLFSFGDDVYINTSSGTYQFNLLTHTLSLSTLSISPYNGYDDAASDPGCFLELPFGTATTSWDCEIVGYQSEKPHAPIYGCVEKTYPQVGAFLTEQDCIDSNCGSLQAVNIQCSRCDSGSAVSNMFPGVTCPPGWQPSSLGDPCKPLGGPTPTGPISSTPRPTGSTGTDSSISGSTNRTGSPSY